jgi:hypothetical protein
VDESPGALEAVADLVAKRAAHNRRRLAGFRHI